MARIVLGVATSHGPMLTTPAENWDQRVGFDRKFTEHAFRGRTYNFDQLVKLRANEGLDRQITKEMWIDRHAQCQRAIASLADVFAAAKPDIAVIFGNDQMEMFTDAAIPAFAVYWGETIENRIGPEEERANQAPGVAVAQAGRIPPDGATYPGLPALGRHIIEHAMADRYDVTTLKRLRPGRGAIPHAYGFVYRQIMRDKVVPNVPLVLNTFYPPNQPTVRRCYEFGQSVLKAVESWPGDQKVALIASGGLSHFVIDEEADGEVFAAIRERRPDRIEALGEPIFQQGTSEVKNWVALMGAMATLGFASEVHAYVPCYRSLAGTGNAMGFVHWHA
jgi:3-O-methylgallate 3,4-dioxygenase